MNNISRTVERAKERGSPGGRPSATALSAAFQAYQDEQRGRLRQLVFLSNAFAKITTYATPLYRVLANWLMPAFGDERVVADQIGQYVAAAPRLEFLPSAVDSKATRIPWRGSDRQLVQPGGQDAPRHEKLSSKVVGREDNSEISEAEGELASYKAIVDELANLRTTSGSAVRV